MDVLEIIKSIFVLWWYPEQRAEEGRKECKKCIRLRAVAIMVIAIIAFILIIILFVFSTNLPQKVLDTTVFEKNLLWINSITLSDLLKTIFLVGLFLCLVIFFYALGVFKHWKLRDESEFVDIRYIQKLFDERYELDNRRCSECDKYSDTGKLIVKALETYDYSQFISFFKDATGLKEKELNLIKEDFKTEHKYAKLLCVLSNPQYYTPDTNPDQLEGLVHYFISFYPYINSEKRIKRVFSLSAIGNTTDPSYNEKAKWLFQYLLVNYITGVETCLLVNEEDLKIHVDYVVGKYPEGSNRLYSKRKSYFSYEVQAEKKKDYTIQSSDQLVINILEADFYERWKGNIGEDERDRHYLKKGIWTEIKDSLGLTEEDVASVLLSLAKHISSCKKSGFTNADRNALFDELRMVAEDKSLGLVNKKEIIKKINKIANG